MTSQFTNETVRQSLCRVVRQRDIAEERIRVDRSNVGHQQRSVSVDSRPRSDDALHLAIPPRELRSDVHVRLALRYAVDDNIITLSGVPR